MDGNPERISPTLMDITRYCCFLLGPKGSVDIARRRARMLALNRGAFIGDRRVTRIIRRLEMTKTIYCATEKRIFGKTILAVFLLCAWVASSHAQAVPPPAATYVYWTNSNNGSIGRATTSGTDVNEKFIPSGPVGGAGLTVDGKHIYWSTANGGTATDIARANLNGTGVNRKFITGAQNPCGVAVNSSHIYWAGDVGTSIGRANLNGTGVNQNFISTGTGVCGVIVTSSHIYWANYQTQEIGRANLDGSGINQSFISGAGSGAGIAIEGNHIYFTTSGGTSIGRANLDGSDANPHFITGLNGEVAFLAVDGTYIFWADWGTRGSGTTIGRAKINGTGKNQTFVKGTNGGFGIAVTGGNP
jgi:virginiamycin B lyase